MHTVKKRGRAMTGIKAGLIASTLGLTGLAQIDPVTTGQKIAALSATGILGVVSVALIWALLKLYKAREEDNKQHSEKLYTLIEKQTAASQAMIDGQKQSNNLMVEVKDSNNNVASAVDKIATHCAAVTRMRVQQ